MSTVGNIERITQQRVVKLFQDVLGYDYLGNWIDRVGNRNIDTDLSRSFLKKQGYDDALITKALHQLNKVAGDQTKSLYDCNKAMYELLRYGVKVKADIGENTQTVWLIDWKHPLNNHFGIAEEVTVKGADAKANTKRPDVVIYVNGIALGVLELTSSIYEACKCYELFDKTELAGKCAIVTSYAPSPADIKGEETGEGLTERLRKYEIYNQMLGDQAAEDFEKAVKKKFIEQPGQMKLLIVVDKLLTGFDAPSAKCASQVRATL